MWALGELNSADVTKLAIFYASWLYIPVAPILMWVVIKQTGALRWAAAVFLFFASLLAYARFVEPRILHVNHHEIALPGCFQDAGSMTLSVVADFHIGLFANSMPVDQIAQKLETIPSDVVLIPGDFTYKLDPDVFDEAFGPLNKISAPTYVVMGNHDVGHPGGVNFTVPLTESLTRLGLIAVDDQKTLLSGPNGAVEIVGLSDLWLGRQNIAQLKDTSERPRLLMTHNPDTVLTLPRWAKFDLMITGHTHGGQIYLGPLTCVLAPMACNVAREGFVTTEQGRSVFITAGTGMVGLPMRFLVPPRIDVLDLQWRACD